VSDTPSWITVSQSSGSGNGGFTVTVTPNTTGAARVGSIAIRGNDGLWIAKTFTVWQQP